MNKTMDSNFYNDNQFYNQTQPDIGFDNIESHGYNVRKQSRNSRD